MKLIRRPLMPAFVALAVAALIALAPAGTAPDPPPKTNGIEPAAVPFTMLPSNHMVVQVTLNGQGPFRMIFDLGSPVTLVGNNAAERSGAVGADAPRSIFFGTRGEAKVKSLEMGTLKAVDVPIVVMDHPVLKALGGLLGKPIDGIIGYTFFARYKTTIDYKASELTFAPVEFHVRDLMKDLQRQMLAPKAIRTRVLAPKGLWGLTLGEPAGGVLSPGVPVTAVRTGSPAAAAGLKPGDLLTTLDGRWTATVTDAYAATSSIPPGQAAEVVVVRDGTELKVMVTPKDGI